MKGLESLKERATEKDRRNVDDLIASSTRLLDTVKHAIILLQVILFAGLPLCRASGAALARFLWLMASHGFSLLASAKSDFAYLC